MTPEAVAFFHLLSYVVTWISSRVGSHSRVHMTIAEVAIAAETVGMYAAWGWFAGWLWMRDVAVGAMVIVVSCMVGVAITDGWWRRVASKLMPW